MHAPLKLKRGEKHFHIPATKLAGDYWYSTPSSIRYNQHEILQEVIKGREIEFIGGDEYIVMLGITALLEKGSNQNEKIDFKKSGDTQLLNRIIRAGGFTEYIENLEELLNEQSKQRQF